jgi:hypothetical protein
MAKPESSDSNEGNAAAPAAATPATGLAPEDPKLNGYFLSSNPVKTRQLPAWLDHFNARDLKTLFKCSLAAWIMTILILINPTLRVLGQSAFFGW